MQPLEPVAVAFQHARADQPGDEVGRAQLAEKAGVEGDLVQPVHDVLRRARDRGALDRIDLDDDHVPAGRFVEQRPEGRIAGVAAVPISLVADLNRLEQLRQAGRGHHVVGGQNPASKDLTAAGPDVGRRDEQLRRVERAQALEVDEPRQVVEQGIEVEGVQRIRAGELRHRLCPGAEKGRPRPDHAPGTQPGLDQLALDGGEAALCRDGEPKPFQLLPRALASPLGEARRIDHGVERARARAADRADLDPIVLDQRVENAPGVGAVRSPALQGEVDGLAVVLVQTADVVHAAVQPPSIERLAPVIWEAASEQR